jgi:hypothetical protein
VKLTKRQVAAAIVEWNKLGRKKFLRKHGVAGARRYFVVDGPAHYDLKALVSAATGIKPKVFHTYEGQAALEALGYKVVGPPAKSAATRLRDKGRRQKG